MENMNPIQNARHSYRTGVRQMGKKEFTLLKMQEYGFWPDNLKTPYEMQSSETEEEFKKRKRLLDKYHQLAERISQLYQEKDEIDRKLYELKKEYISTWDSERIRKDVAQKIMQESIKRRMERKKQKELEQAQRSLEWKRYREKHIVFIGRGYSGLLQDRQTDPIRLGNLSLPLVEDDHDLAALLEIEYKELRFLAYHRDVVLSDHYHFYKIPKRNGGERSIAAPKPLLKQVQRTILTKILQQLPVSEEAHGFQKERSVVTGAQVHDAKPELLINMDIENFFPTITFQRVRGMFCSFGYSGYVASLLAMLCTYCERTPIEVKGQIKLVRCSERILPQGSPASPMITNMICRNLDSNLALLSREYRYSYSRYADDMSFSFAQRPEERELRRLLLAIRLTVEKEGFKINREKTRFLRNNNRQCITGVVINNEEIGVPKVWLKKMRAALHHANQLKEKNKLTQSKKNEIAGMASWLSSVNKNRYQRIISQAIQLLDG